MSCGRRLAALAALAPEKPPAWSARVLGFFSQFGQEKGLLGVRVPGPASRTSGRSYDFGPQSSLCGDLGRGLLGWGKEKTRDVCGSPSRTDLPSILKPSWQTCLFPICGAIRTKGHLGKP